jgi:cell division septal protein FtsQ
LINDSSELTASRTLEAKSMKCWNGVFILLCVLLFMYLCFVWQMYVNFSYAQ